MVRRLQAYLHQNRLGTFNFRWRPPRDVADCFAQRAFEISLRTKNRSEAWLRALPIALAARRLIVDLRSQPMNRRKLTRFDLVRSIQWVDGTEQKVDYDPSNPAEVAEANRIFAELREQAAETPAIPEATETPRAVAARHSRSAAQPATTISCPPVSWLARASITRRSTPCSSRCRCPGRARCSSTPGACTASTPAKPAADHRFRGYRPSGAAADVGQTAARLPRDGVQDGF